ncbi:MAG: DUF4956 domain-containing protein [Planctomycetota bacterium]|nr:DUF4956 domain-containing protein [Planctomycetota bacterium]
MNELQQAWQKFETSVSGEGNVFALHLGLYLLLSGALSWFVRILYQRCATTPTDTDSLSRVFPLLSIVTTAMIAVVKSSLALSLGLVGALSIVRFRAAIKEPEELVYLFLCIAIGLSLGAEQPLLAVTLVAVASIYVFAMSQVGKKKRCRLLLTVTGDSQRYFSGDDGGVMAAIDAVAGNYTLQRMDVDKGRGQVRVALAETNSKRTADIVAKLRQRLPDCDISFVNLNSHL